MVWTIRLKHGFPYNYPIRPLNGDLTKVEYCDSTYELGTVGGLFEAGDLHRGRAIKEHNLPTKFLWELPKDCSPPEPPDMLSGSALILVNEKAKRIFEELEPSTHQFFPVKIETKHGIKFENFFVLNVCNRVDGVNREKSSAELEGIAYLPSKNDDIIVSEKNTKDVHFWVDIHLYDSFFVSDHLRGTLISDGITGVIFDERLTDR